MNALATAQLATEISARTPSSKMRIFSSLGNLLRLACLARRIKARAVSPERVAALDDLVLVETVLVGSFSSSYMFTVSGPARGAGLDCLRRTPSGQTQAGQGPTAPAV
jgi:hypothetical protein